MRSFKEIFNEDTNQGSLAVLCPLDVTYIDELRIKAEPLWHLLQPHLRDLMDKEMFKDWIHWLNNDYSAKTLAYGQFWGFCEAMRPSAPGLYHKLCVPSDAPMNVRVLWEELVGYVNRIVTITNTIYEVDA